MVTERTIINALIIGATIILAPFIVSSSLTGEYGPALLFGVLPTIILAFFFLKEKLCICPMLGTFMLGTLNFLPLPLQWQHIASILLILYYVTGYVIIRQRKIKLGKPEFFWPILIITLIVLYHNHNLNVKMMGGNTEGAKPAIMICLIVLAYFCGINISTPSVEFLSKVPLYCVILTFVTSMPFFLTTYIPALAPYAYYITDNVNVEAYVNSQASSGVGETSGPSRFAALGSLGGVLQLYLLSHYPIGTWLRPERWWVAILSLICVMLAVETGYRSILFGFAFSTLVGTWCYYSWRAIVLPAVFVIMVFLLNAGVTSNLFNLPLNRLPPIAQRTMSFLPGEWSEEAKDSGDTSNAFRKNIQDVYIKEYLMNSPLLGNGFDIDTKEINAIGDLIKSGQKGQDPAYIQAKIFIETKAFHTGWISLYDTVGIIGSLAFIALGWNEICLVAHFIFGPKADRRSSLFPLYVWLACCIVPWMVSFFTVFGDFGQTFPSFCILAIVLSHLSDLENSADVPLVPSDRKPQVEFSGLSGAQYGYQSRR